MNHCLFLPYRELKLCHQ